MSASGSTSASGAGGLRRPGTMRGKLKAPKRYGLDVAPAEMWSRLANAIGQIQGHNVSSLSYEEHYRYAYNLVLFKEGSMLYDGVRRQVEAHLNKQCVDYLVPAFPPGGLASLPSDIVLPRNLPTGAASASTSKQPNLKGKGKANEPIVLSDDDDEPRSAARATVSGSEPASSMAVGSASGGDRTDAASRSQSAERLLKAMKQVWDDHCACMGKLRDVLKYVDRVYVPENNVLPIWDLGLELFRDTVILSKKHPIGMHLFSALLTQIQLERQGQLINRSSVKANTDMLASLTQPRPGVPIAGRPTVYKHTFEPAFLATSAEFYKNEAARLLDSSDARAYLRHAEKRFIEEEGRVAVFLAATTDAELRQILERHLLSTHLKTILEMPGSGLHNMLENHLKDDLRRLYKLFSRIKGDGPQQLKAGLKSFITKKGADINAGVVAVTQGAASGTAAAAPASSPQATLALRWVEDVLAFKTKFDDILRTSFDDDKGVEAVLNEAFESFINVNNRAPEFISLFIDENLKKGLKGKTEEEVEDTLNRTIVVFRFLHEKDVFERYYKAHLSKRLLQNRSVSDDAERGMMAKLKIECGHQYVQKLQGMLNDVKVSEETGNAFSEHLRKTNRPMPFDLSVSVLTSTYWPISGQVQPCTMSPAMLSARQAYENFYQSRHSGRVLSWHPNLGSADVRVQFKSRRHELNVSTYALVVLSLFESTGSEESLSYSTIKGETGMPENDLKRTLQSLACAKYKILLKEPKGRDVGEGDRFTFNEGFSCPLARIKIATIAAGLESDAERRETVEKIEEERKLAVEACVVRVMKDRKTSTHNDLVNEVIRQLGSRFQPLPAMVKKRIESLIDREYLERREGERGVYDYVA
ncbi:Cullin-domain-containing protein [Jaminaea rosea]|uniref:Cullin-domain-containing protein n=1 Tax=Jaminaea rosea TaxID=1569628 RepID=A0A316UPL3_9BASI|nr:Cullin-domain-containing protein [Jaminaea rosea]PWN27242.1 Cullin-domain-containing protein [Jaminaea rosea]